MEEKAKVNCTFNKSEALGVTYDLKERFYCIFKAKSSLEAKHKLSN